MDGIVILCFNEIGGHPGLTPWAAALWAPEPVSNLETRCDYCDLILDLRRISRLSAKHFASVF